MLCRAEVAAAIGALAIATRSFSKYPLTADKLNCQRNHSGVILTQGRS